MKRFLTIAALALTSSLLLTDCNKIEAGKYYGFSEKELGELAVKGSSEEEKAKTVSDFLGELNDVVSKLGKEGGITEEKQLISQVQGIVDRYNNKNPRYFPPLERGHKDSD